MPQDKAPAYQWYPKDAETDEAYRLMTCEQLGVYERLRDHQWIEGSLPADIDKLAIIVGHGMSGEHLREIFAGVSECFPEVSPGRLQNERLERQRREHRRFVKTQTAHGIRGAEKRWGRHSDPIAKPQSDPIVSPLAENSSSSASSSSSATATASAQRTLLSRTSSAPHAAADALVALWNRIVTPPIPQVAKLTADRRAKLDARLRSLPDLEAWATAIEWLNGQDWCRAPGTGDHPNWTANLDWLCAKDGTVQKYLERAKTAMPGPALVSSQTQRNMAAMAGAAARLRGQS